MLLRGKTTEQKLLTLSENIADQIESYADELVSKLVNERVFLGRRSASLRREAIAYHAAKILILKIDVPEFSQATQLLRKKLKEKAKAEDLEHRNFHMQIPGGSASGMYEANLLEGTISDRIDFYKHHYTKNANLNELAPIAFAAAHILQREQISKLNLEELVQSLENESESTKENNITYPDPRRDAIILEWISRTDPLLETQCDSYFKIGKRLHARTKAKS